MVVASDRSRVANQRASGGVADHQVDDEAQDHGTDQRRQEEHLRLLMRELNHRCKNLLGLVQSVARVTAARTPETFLPNFEERLRAMAAAHDLLVGRDWRDVLLADLVRSQVVHLGELADELLVRPRDDDGRAGIHVAA